MILSYLVLFTTVPFLTVLDILEFGYRIKIISLPKTELFTEV